jgi:hypothetical protein
MDTENKIQKDKPAETDEAANTASPEVDQPLSEEEAKRQALRKKKPLGPVVKPLTKEQIEEILRDPELAERNHLSDAMPKGWDDDYQDSF